MPGNAGSEQTPADHQVGPPAGIRWRLTSGLTRRSRQTRLATFMKLLAPTPTDTVLDVGVTDTDWRSSNFLEDRYPWPERITAIGLHEMQRFQAQFPSVTFVVADGRQLPFPDAAFDIGFSNAVVEHVGSRADQRRFVSEMVRTCRRVFISTPDARFPIDPHTLLPFVHWLPRPTRESVLRWTGNGRWATEGALNPLSALEFVGLFPAGSAPRLYRQRMFGLSSVLAVVAGQTRDRT
jgi:hypothetical protein